MKTIALPMVFLLSMLAVGGCGGLMADGAAPSDPSVADANGDTSSPPDTSWVDDQRAAMAQQQANDQSLAASEQAAAAAQQAADQQVQAALQTQINIQAAAAAQ